MSREDKREIRCQALRKEVRACSGVQAYSDLLELGRTRVSNRINQDINTRYEYTENFLKISLYRLSPFIEKGNEIINSGSNKNKFSVQGLPIGDIVANPSLEERSRQDSILIDKQDILIAGLEQFNLHKTEGTQKTLGIILDLKKGP